MGLQINRRRPRRHVFPFRDHAAPNAKEDVVRFHGVRLVLSAVKPRRGGLFLISGAPAFAILVGVDDHSSLADSQLPYTRDL